MLDLILSSTIQAPNLNKLGRTDTLTMKILRYWEIWCCLHHVPVDSLSHVRNAKGVHGGSEYSIGPTFVREYGER